MVNYKTIRVPAEDYEQAKQSKHDSETWGEFVQRCTEQPPEVREFVEAGKQNMRNELLTSLQATNGDIATDEHIEELSQQIAEQSESTESIDYAEIETRVEKVLERILR